MGRNVRSTRIAAVAAIGTLLALPALAQTVKVTPLAPTPFATFLSTIGTCAGIYVLGFCRQRGIPTEGIRLVQRMSMNPATRLVDQVQVTIELPAGFPEKYADAVVRAAEQCAVKKHFEHPPVISVDSALGAAAASA